MPDETKERYELPEATAKEFKVRPGAPPVFHSRQHGDIDIRTLTPEKAKALIEAGCKHIVAINPEPAGKAKQ